ncbi:alcohol dehydrogenase [Phaffia rhodozyma]|uniref:Alcohol dehydrogenase n=1 Tax=Phaffia rhodozyma TaxID=264483 RepID=A0A0F7SMH3_PHARH|nr:alcohol dehydrogenase [Phaffia rhodozyma]
MSDGNWTKKTFTLNTGDKIPAFGLGTWQSGPNEVRKAVAAALKAGYRHIDTAAAYGNEAEVGQGIKDSGVPREEIWITTKLDNPHHKRAHDALADSLKKLDTDYIDLWLMHWPVSSDPADVPNKVYDDWNFVDTWKVMEEIYNAGDKRVRNIGISNFDITSLNKLLPTVKVTPAVNQIELHPNNPTPKLVAFCNEKGIHNTAYSCLGSTDSPLAKDKTLASIADKYKTSTQKVLLAWGLQKGFSVIPKSVTPSRIEGNFDIDGLVLEQEDVDKLSSLPDRFKVCGDSWVPVTVFHEQE